MQPKFISYIFREWEEQGQGTDLIRLLWVDDLVLIWYKSLPLTVFSQSEGGTRYLGTLNTVEIPFTESSTFMSFSTNCLHKTPSLHPFILQNMDCSIWVGEQGTQHLIHYMNTSIFRIQNSSILKTDKKTKNKFMCTIH